MKSFAPIYGAIGVSCILSLTIAGAGAWILTLPAHIEVAGIPKVVQARVGHVDERYVDATARHFVGLLMHWNSTTRAMRISSAGKMLDPALYDHFRTWVRRYYPALEWFDKIQSFRIDTTAITEISPGKWEVVTLGRATSSYSGLGEEERQVEIRLLVAQTIANEVNPFLVQIAGLKVTDQP